MLLPVPGCMPLTYSRSSAGHEKPIFLKIGFFCQNTPKMGLFDFQHFSIDRIYSQKTGFETRFFENTRFLSVLRQNMPVNQSKMIPNGTF